MNEIFDPRNKNKKDYFPETKRPQPNLELILDYLDSRFGITKQYLDEFNLAFYLGSQGKIFLGPKKTIFNPKTAIVGLLCFRAESAIKPSSIFFQIIGNKITKNFILVDKSGALKFLSGYDLLQNEFDPNNSDEGYVLVKYQDFSLGCALLKNNQIRNTLPKAKRLDIEYL